MQFVFSSCEIEAELYPNCTQIIIGWTLTKFDYFLFWLKIQDFHHHRTYFKYGKTILKMNPILNLKLIWQQTWLTFERSFTKCMFCFYKKSFWCCFKTFKLMSSLGCCKVFKAIQHYVIKFIGDLWEIGGFLHAPYNWNIVESGVKHHEPTPNPLMYLRIKHTVYVKVK